MATILRAVLAAGVLAAAGATWIRADVAASVAAAVPEVVPAVVPVVAPAADALAADALVVTIALGSCIKEDQPSPALEAAARIQPDVFVFLGDNIYGDSTDMEVFRTKYANLEAQPGLRALRAGPTRVLATWDDHDFGDNDMGVEYTMKRQTQAIFCDFWKEPADSKRRTRDGIYDSVLLGPQGQRVQIILLDARFNRSPLKRRTPSDTPLPRGQRGEWWSAGYGGDYLAHTDTTTTLLGEAQWAWLEEQLKVPAEVRLIASSVQFASEEHRFESWANFPHERVRMARLIKRTGAAGVVFASGDRHWGELSAVRPGKLTSTPPTFEDPSIKLASDADQPTYPLFDVTASALNRSASVRTERNMHRLGDAGEGKANDQGGPYLLGNFGLITINWDQRSERRARQGEAHVPDPTLTLEIRDARGAGVLRHQVRLAELK